MPLTLDEVLSLEQNLRQEIAAKQRLLTAYETFRTEMGTGATFPAATAAATSAATPLPSSPPVAPLLPVEQEPPRYVNPNLMEWKKRYFGAGGIVRWAILRMTHDYCGRDLGELLRQEGEYLSPAEVSVVLTRLKKRGEIVEVRSGTGRTGAIFRRPSNPLPVREGQPIPADNAAGPAERAESCQGNLPV